MATDRATRESQKIYTVTENTSLKRSANEEFMLNLPRAGYGLKEVTESKKAFSDRCYERNR